MAEMAGLGREVAWPNAERIGTKCFAQSPALPPQWMLRFSAWRSATRASPGSITLDDHPRHIGDASAFETRADGATTGAWPVDSEHDPAVYSSHGQDATMPSQSMR